MNFKSLSDRGSLFSAHPGTVPCWIFIALASACGASFAQKLPFCKGNSDEDRMVRVGSLCVDQFEASVWSGPGGQGTRYPQGNPRYPSWFPSNGNWTRPLYAASIRDQPPSAFLTWFQAQQACALSGKRLLTNAEWQMAAAGTPDPGWAGDGITQCNTYSTGPVKTGAALNCVSRWGVHDMVGNLREWVADWIQGPGINASTVTGVFNPLAQTFSTPDYGGDGLNGINEAFHQEAPQSAEPNRSDPDAMPAGIARGGLWNNGPGAGVFTMEATHTPSSRDNGTGFRCAR